MAREIMKTHDIIFASRPHLKAAQIMLYGSMDIAFAPYEGMNEMFHEMIGENVALLSGFNLEDYFPSLGWLSSLFGLDERAKRNFIRWDGVLSQIIQEHTNKKDRSNQKENDFVDVLLSLKEDPKLGINLDNERIKAILMDMFSAGTDTTYAVLEWAMAELIRNPNVMKKLQDEVKGVASGKSMVNEHDLGEMHYLKAVIKEILRLHPPAALLIPRESMDSCQLEGYEIPKKTRVVINVWAIARDPKVWENPNEFIPERFLNNPIDFKGQDYQYLPFGSGRRICPGMQFAVNTTELTLANLVYRFDWLLPNTLVGEVNMDEAPGGITKMMNNLHLVPMPCF
ncbi:hypothetical protein J5N97_022439 [Dioscorea zingiberensis]|uniref:Cytochrome P450 n=1 Tax=Dioscorea zingiberensis TaxID=325984 RepID=A0A9D5CAH5_9LILI|nr:hypothetical protein J5N97_022439 [Dioscorea zingiberensis]